MVDYVVISGHRHRDDTTTSTIAKVFALKITSFYTHMYELYLATTTDHLWSTMWLRVVTSNATSTTIGVFVLKKDAF